MAYDYGRARETHRAHPGKLPNNPILTFASGTAALR